MKKYKKKILVIVFIIGILLILSTIISIIAINFDNTYENNTDEDLIIVNDILQEITVDSEDDILMEDENGIIGTLEIPKLSLVAPIKEGTDQEVLAEYIGHFTSSSIWNGNVALASHNRGSLVKHYFDSIYELVNGDIIIYKTRLGERSYQVTETKEIENTDWSVVTENNTQDKNTITLLTCITNHPEKRFCVIATEKEN